MKKRRGASFGRDENFALRVTPRKVIDSVHLSYAPHAGNPKEGKAGKADGGNFDAPNWR